MEKPKIIQIMCAEVYSVYGLSDEGKVYLLQNRNGMALRYPDENDMGNCKWMILCEGIIEPK